ncbi:MAG: metallophosphoesterase [Gammaproteobacteria bacterium]|nr:metallophosphoesterase [Gammaproteobacteria bacterium]
MKQAKKRKSLLKIIKKAFSDLEVCENIDLKDTYKLPDKKITFPLENYPIKLHISYDMHELHLYPEFPIDQTTEVGEDTCYILFEPESYYSKIGGFYRLCDDDKIILGSGNEKQHAFLKTSAKLQEQQLSISNDEGKLIFKCHHVESGTCISPLLKEKNLNKINDWRKEKISRLSKIIGNPTSLLSNEEALEQIKKVNAVLAKEKYREKNNEGKPGGVIQIPDKCKVVIIGDLHARIDNLLTLLSQNNFLSEMENNRVRIVVLGDAVHPEVKGHYDEMESSVLMMDLIFKLKLQFPEQFFYIRGNHDSFSEELSKHGVSQGILWKKKLKKLRGNSYLKEMEKFYEQLAYVAFSKHFVCAHAGAPTSAVNQHALVNITHYPKLLKDLLNKRLKTSNRLSGYTKGDINKLKKCLNLDKSVPFIVGHTPMDHEETVWKNVGEIQNHHIIYSAQQDIVGAMVQINHKIYPLTYMVEPISKLLK